MSSLLTQCHKLFKTKNLYEILGVAKSATREQLKKGYYTVSLRVHPDKVTDEKKKANATEQFKLLSKVYSILNDVNKRKVYDKTGEIEDDDEFGFSEDKDWAEYWRELFPTVTVYDIEKFTSEYKGSEDELSSLKDAYIKHKGDMQKMIDSILCATLEDEERFRGILTPLINSEELPHYKKFTDEPETSKKKRRTKASKEAKEAENAVKELKGGSLAGYSDLALALQRNKEKRGGLISYLEQKYANNDDNSEGDLVIDTKPAKRKSAASKSSKRNTKKQKTT